MRIENKCFKFKWIHILYHFYKIDECIRYCKKRMKLDTYVPQKQSYQKYSFKVVPGEIDAPIFCSAYSIYF